ncbi:hypothetical protein [Blastomonas sp.]|uniref:hypothetical protein n=1 Tax=Blastomonas sp. TaxID=1909299 RepID=UPI0035931852
MSEPLTPERIAAFLDHLAETSHVSKSARRAGVTRGQVYRLRSVDADFAQAWADAAVSGYTDLELEMLGRARFGVKKPYKRADGKQGRMTEYDDAQSLKMLMAYKAGLVREGDDRAAASMANLTGARDRLAAKLELIRARLNASTADGAGGDPQPD